MSISNYPRAIGELLVIGLFATGLVAAKVFGVRIDQWSPFAKGATFVVVVGAVTFATMRLTRGGRSRD